jgi:SM-20-related protein
MDLKIALEDFKSKGYLIWDGFLSPDEVNAVLADYRSIFNKRGLFKKAGLGNQEGPRQINAEIRTDESHWLDPLHLTVPQALFWNRLEELKSALNEYLFLGLWSLEGHYSWYPEGGFYRRHFDSFLNNNQRVMSNVLYFNPEWTDGDGGELRIHASDSEKIDIAPIGGRLVCFLSAQVAHEVLRTHKNRLSFAGWWRTRV